MSNQFESDVAVIGGGLVGIAVACGLRRQGIDVIALDEGDDAVRASRGNFGLVWVQGKGSNLAAYTPWALEAVRRWPELDQWLKSDTGIDVGLEQEGGLYFCLTEEELETRSKQLATVRANYNGEYKYEMLNNAKARKMVPKLGPTVAGASYSPYDGQANPIRLLRAFHRLFKAQGGLFLSGAGVTKIERNSHGYVLTTPRGLVRARKIVLGAGLGNVGLAKHLGIDLPIVPVRGQVMVTERVPPLFNFAMEQVRQTDDGTLLLGGSWEEVGFDLRTTHEITQRIARSAVQIFPMLSDVRVVRSWSALRIISPDASPIYEELVPGAFLVTCHSGVSLAALHTFEVARWIGEGRIPENMSGLSLKRFSSNGYFQ